MGVLEKAERFFDLKKRKQQKNIDDLKKIIRQLKVKMKISRKRLEGGAKAEKREKLEREYKAVRKLFRKGRRRLSDLKEVKSSS